MFNGRLKKVEEYTPMPATPADCRAANTDPPTTLPMVACHPAAKLPATTPADPNPAAATATGARRVAVVPATRATPTITTPDTILFILFR